MTDNILSAVLTFGLLLAGTAAIGSEMFNTHQAGSAPMRVVQLPTVTIVAHRQAPSEFVMLPAVTITGHRDTSTRVAAETQVSDAHRVE